MSYLIDAYGPRREIQNKLKEKVDAYQLNVARKESQEHIDAAVKAALAAMRVVGQEDDHLLVTISGHANPDHGKAKGYSDEQLSIQISIVAPPAEEVTQ